MSESKRYYKLYKSGSKWVAVAIASAGAVVLSGNATQSVAADTTTGQMQTNTEQMQTNTGTTGQSSTAAEHTTPSQSSATSGAVKTDASSTSSGNAVKTDKNGIQTNWSRNKSADTGNSDSNSVSNEAGKYWPNTQGNSLKDYSKTTITDFTKKQTFDSGYNPTPVLHNSSDLSLYIRGQRVDLRNLVDDDSLNDQYTGHNSKGHSRLISTSDLGENTYFWAKNVFKIYNEITHKYDRYDLKWTLQSVNYGDANTKIALGIKGSQDGGGTQLLNIGSGWQLAHLGNFFNTHLQFFKEENESASKENPALAIANADVTAKAVSIHMGFSDIDANEAVQLTSGVIKKVYVDKFTQLAYQDRDGHLSVTRKYNDSSDVSRKNESKVTFLMEMDVPVEGFDLSVATIGNQKNSSNNYIHAQGSKVAPSLLPTMKYTEPLVIAYNKLDCNGNTTTESLQPAKTFEGLIGDEYTVDSTGNTVDTSAPSTITDSDGNIWKLVSEKTQGNPNGSYVDGINEIDYYYQIFESKTINETIHYVYNDGTKAHDDYVAKSVEFTRKVSTDAVTGKKTYGSWSAKQSFAAVTSPAIKGYTPDKAEIEAQTVSGDDNDVVKTVTYKANTQKLDVAFIDDTTGETLKTVTKDGVSDGSANYNTKNDIDGYKAQHYNIVSDSTNGKDLILDHDDNADQTYEVHFVHGTHTINQTTSPKQTIHYVYADGLVRQGKAADDNVQQLSFKRDGYNDEVTGVDHWNAWTPANSNYSAVDSPVIQGYTPNKSVIEKSTVNPTDKDTEITVTYNADKQTIKIKYIDDTTGKTLKQDNLDGTSDQDTKYTTGDSIKQYEDQHYKLVSDSTNGKDLILDHDDNADQTYYVYFVHGTQKVNRQDTVTSTIDYKFEDGKTAQPTVTQTKHFSEDGVKDLVTGKITWDEAEPQKFDDIATKSIVGYTPDTDNVAGSTVNFGDKDIEVTVTYHNNAQTAKITYIDDTTKTNLDSRDANGKFNQVITFATAPTDEIANYEKQGYVLVSNSFNNQTYAADNKKNIFYVHLKHGIVPVTPDTDHNDVPKNTVKEAQPDQLTKEVDLTVQYVNSDDAKFTGELPANQNQKVTFTGTAYVDKVTGQLVNAKKQEDGTWVVDDSKTDKPQVIWKADGKDSFDAVISPVEKGYHLTGIDSHKKGNNVEEITGLTQESDSITVTVTYTKNGKIIPVDKDGNPITGADQPVFPTDPNDPSRVDSGKIPDLSDKGYHPLDKAVKPDGTVDPDSEDPINDITVKYVKSGTISVKYHDNTEDKDIDGYGKNASGDEGAPFNYDPATDLAKLKGKGYVLDGKVSGIPGQFTASAQEVIINLKHGTTTVTSNNPGHPGEPVDPKNSEGPKYPNGTELDQVKRTGTQTIHYVGAGDKTPADNKQTFIFTREITFDNVTGKIISKTPWNVQSYTFGTVKTPVIPGYHADKAVAGGETVTPSDLNKVITVTYAPDVNPGNPSDHGDIPSPEPTPEPETTPNPTPDDQPDSETSSRSEERRVGKECRSRWSPYH